MQLFSAKVRIKNSLHNEVPKIGLTAAEITVLRYLHGLVNSETGELDNSCVLDIKQTGETARSDSVERERLQSIYGVALRRQGKTIATLFGVGNPLPQTVDGMEAVVVLEPGENIERTKRAYNKKAKAPVEAPDELHELAG
jgi:hypothetical protein